MIRRASRWVALGAAGLMAFSLASAAVPAFADKDPYDKRKELSQQKENLQSELEGVSANLAQAYLDLADTNSKITTAQAALDAATAALAEAERKDKDLADRLTTAQDQETTLTSEIAADNEKTSQTRDSLVALAQAQYRNGGVSPSVTVALGASTPEQFVEQSTMAAVAEDNQSATLDGLQQAAGEDRNRQARLEAVRAEIAQLKEESAANVAAADAARSQAQQQRTDLENLKVEQTARTATIESQKAQTESDLAQSKADLQSVNSEIAQIEAEKAKQRSQGGGGADPAPVSSGSLGVPVPLPVHVTSPYGNRIYPITGTWAFHPGTDLRAACGVPIYAAAAGTVQKAANGGSHGNQVFLDNGYVNGKSVITIYNHLQAFAVHKGQTVSRGQVLGYSGQTGNVTGCHLHFEVWANGVRQDPANWVPEIRAAQS